MFLPSQIPLEDKMLVLQNIFQRRQVALQLLTEMSDLDDFQVLINTEKDVYFSQIKESRENIKENLQTLDENLKMFGEKQAEIEETMRFWMMMRGLGQRNDEIDTTLREGSKHQKAMKKAASSLKEKKARTVQEEKDFIEIERFVREQHELLQQQVSVARNKLHKGLTAERIQKFHKFEADDSLVGEQCAVCKDDIEVGRKMMRLDCKHQFCQPCAEGWLANHNTCPVCREVFVNA